MLKKGGGRKMYTEKQPNETEKESDDFFSRFDFFNYSDKMAEFADK